MILVWTARAAPWLAAAVVFVIVLTGRRASPSVPRTHTHMQPLSPQLTVGTCPCHLFLAVITPMNNYGALLFSLHPLFMSAAFVCFMPLALTT